MNIRDLTYVKAVADHGHFGRAAKACNASQAAVSGQVKKLEAELGVKLFERDSRNVHVTDVGRQIVKLAEQALSVIDSIKLTAETAREPYSGTFKIGAFPTLASYFFPQILPPITGAMPNLRLILTEEKTDILLERLKTGLLDAAFIALPIEDRTLKSIPLFEDKFYVAMPADHDLAEEAAIDHGALNDRRLLLLEDGHCLRDQALDVCQLVGAGEVADYKGTSLETLRQMVKIKSGITLMPEIALGFNDPNIVYVPFKDPQPSRQIGLVWRKTSVRKPVIDKVVQICKASIG